jgi:hypothetical protein
MAYITYMDNSHTRSQPSFLGRKMFIWIGLATLAAVLCGGIVLIRNSGPLPKQIRTNTSFTLYYPSSLPKGYTYDKKLTRQDAGIVFYNFRSDKHVISVSQQALPDHPPDINNLGGFSKLDVTAGKAAVGISGSSPTAIVLTNSTIITINGSKDTPQDVVATLAKNLASLPD